MNGDTSAKLRDALRDRYRIERELGQGGMATVYVADDLKHRRKVAIKVLHPELAAALGPERFLREIETTANLRHPHILPLYDSGEAGGFLFYVMPLVEGESLRDRITRERQLPIDDALAIAREVGDALGYAHNRGIVHRDIKPENILLEGGHAFVADFGISRAVSAAGADKLTGTGMSIGTPSYMSPEQATGEENIDGRSDLYALGCVLYEMLGGQPPFTGPTVESVVHQHLVVAPPPITNLRPTVPVAVAGALARTLAKNPADRFNPAAQFVQALSGTAPTPAQPVSTARFRPSLAMVAGGLLLVIIAALLLLRPRGGASVATGAEQKSIAVLPLVNVGGDSTQEYFADGMAEELTNALGKVPGLRVAARTSSYAFKGRRDLDVREVGEKLGVATLLQGTVRRSGNRLRMSVQLTDAREAVELWSQTYDQDANDAFAVQDSITQAIVGRLALSLGGADLAATRAGRTSNSAAHDLYLQGLALVHQGSEPALRRSLDYFRDALTKDPDYAQAYVGQAWAYAYLADAYMLPAIAYDSARLAAQEAQKRGSQAGENLVILAYATYVMDWDLAKANQEQQRAVAASPNSSDVAALYANWLCVAGRVDAGLVQVDRAIALDRLAVLGGFVREWCLYMGHRYDEVIAQHVKTAAIDPNFFYLDSFLGAAYRELGRYEEALVEYRRAQGYMGDLPLHGFAITYARMGKSREAREILNRLVAYGRNHYVNPLFVAGIHASLGEKDRAFEYLERAVRDRTVLAAGVSFWPEFDSLHSDPRFAALVKRAGLPSR